MSPQPGRARSAPGAARALWTAVRLGRRRGAPRTSAVLGSLPRLVPAVVSGRYTGCSRGRLLLMAASAAYVVSPADLLPEGLLGPVGLADDAAVLAWLAGAVLSEGQAFLAWEAGQRASGSSRTGGRGRRGRPDVVPGDVVA
ncbi:DUF1232 domain-containing protein [Streptomyces sp. NP160]|uniref:YkvA family protein n=1 Tax=Streptomyces sp. NP160 TaxID=2586637 RepID=UPI00111960E0|nr:YkvA family protein [Streptomyces sp. NP160]TNM68879.1 DUF1232 domain-containing protein [Streptomyces sp. NP160]